MTDIPSPFFHHNVDCCLANAPLFGRICFQIAQRVRISLLASLFPLTVGLARKRIYRRAASCSPRPSASMPYRFQSTGCRWMWTHSSTSIRHRFQCVMSLASAQTMRCTINRRCKKNEAVCTSTRMTTCSVMYRNGFLDPGTTRVRFSFWKVSRSLRSLSPWVL